MMNFCSHSSPMQLFEKWGVVQSGMYIVWLDILIFMLEQIGNFFVCLRVYWGARG
jgi:hypothetical protein